VAWLVDTRRRCFLAVSGVWRHVEHGCMHRDLGLALDAVLHARLAVLCVMRFGKTVVVDEVVFVGQAYIDKILVGQFECLIVNDVVQIENVGRQRVNFVVLQ
jgi:hypothetical protein